MLICHMKVHSNMKMNNSPAQSLWKHCAYLLFHPVLEQVMPELGEWTSPSFVNHLCAMSSTCECVHVCISECPNVPICFYENIEYDVRIPCSLYIRITDLFDLVKVIYPLEHKAQSIILRCSQILNNAEHLNGASSFSLVIKKKNSL